MPKQIYKIENFHGGLNSSSDPRDVLENELPVATDIMIDEVGKIRTMGSVVAHGSADEQLDNTGASTTGQVVGSGLFHFDHDRTGAEDAGDSETLKAGQIISPRELRDENSILRREDKNLKRTKRKVFSGKSR